MAEIKTYRLYITPQTKINVSENEKWMFAGSVTDKYLLAFGAKKRQRQIDEGKDPKKAIKANAYYNRKQYVLRYYEYKRKVRELFLKSGLSKFPEDNVSFRFFIPMPTSWGKKKRNEHCFEKHQNVPDASNFHKALEDACSDKDRRNWDYRASKFWIDLKEGYIEIEVGGLPEAKGYSPYVREDKIK